jgi:5-methylcytosine-specific restriction protein A
MAPNPLQHLYGSQRWRRQAKRQLRDHPLCAMCLTSGLVVPAQEADHITRHKGDPHAFWNGLLQSLCRACHEAKTAQEEGRERRGFSLDVDGDGWPLDPDHPANRRNARSSP